MIDRKKLSALLSVKSNRSHFYTSCRWWYRVSGSWFTETPNQTLIIGTDTSSRKAKNIRQSPHVAFVIGWDDSKTLQIEGFAEEIDRGEFDRRYRQMYVAKEAGREKYLQDPLEVFFAIKPTWMRYTETNMYPWRVEEEAISTRRDTQI